MSHKWDSLSKPDRAKLLAGAGLPTGLAQLNWSGLQKSERKKLEKGKGWFEAKEPIMTARGIEHLAPEHHRVAIKKEAGKANNERMERKEPSVSKKPKEEKLSERRYKEWYDKGFAEAGKKDSIYKDVKSVEEDMEMVKKSNRTPAPEVYAGIPNLSGLESLAKLEGIRDGLIAKAKKAQEQKEACVDSSGKEYAIAFLRKNPIPLSDIEYYKGRALNRHNPHAISDLVWQKAWNKVGMDGEIMILDSKGDIYLTPYYVDEVMVNRKYVKEGQPEEAMLKRMGEKEPWQMVKQEWLDTNLSKEGQQSKKKKIGNRTLKEWKLGEHRNYVEQAIRDHKPVPEKVLAEYPELTKKGEPETNEENKFVDGILKQASEGATVKEFGTRLYVWRDDEAYATKHITDSEYMELKAIIKGVHQLSRADALKNLKEGREKEAKIVQKIEGRKEQEHKSFKEAQKNPKGGAVAMDEDNLQALSAEMIARRFGLNPEAVYNWGQKHNVILKDIIRNPKPIGDGTNLIEAVLNDTELSKPTINEFLNSKIHDLINSPSFETRGRLRQVLESLGLYTNMFFNHPQIYTDEQLQSVLDKMESTKPDPTPGETMEQIIKSGKEKEETEAEQLKKAREKWIAEEKSKPKRKAARIPEIEFNTEGQTTKKEVKRELTKLSATSSKRFVDKHGRYNQKREKMPDGTYTVTWTEIVQEELPVEGLLIRGLTKEQAEGFKTELQSKVKSLLEISIREGTGGKYELYTQTAINPKSIRGTLALFTKRFGEKPKRGIKKELEHKPAPLLVEYKCGDEPPVKVPIEKLDEEIEKCKEESDKNAELRWKEGNINNPNIKH